MNQIAHFAVIAAIRDRSFERRIGTLAKHASHIGVACLVKSCSGRNIQRLPANRAVFALQGTNRSDASPANRKTGNLQEWSAANAAIGREECEE
jgi:hypothetical protein